MNVGEGGDFHMRLFMVGSYQSARNVAGPLAIELAGIMPVFMEKKRQFENRGYRESHPARVERQPAATAAARNAGQWPPSALARFARRLLVVQGIDDITGDTIVAGNQVDVALGDDVRGDRPVPNCCEIIGRVIGGAASSRVGKHETNPLRTR